MKKIVWLFFFFAVLLPQASWAKNAETTLFPTRVV
jgi:hypothetical protein